MFYLGQAKAEGPKGAEVGRSGLKSSRLFDAARHSRAPGFGTQPKGAANPVFIHGAFCFILLSSFFSKTNLGYRVVF